MENKTYSIKPGILKQVFSAGPKPPLEDVEKAISNYTEKYEKASIPEREIYLRSAREIAEGMAEREDTTREERRHCFDLVRKFKKYIEQFNN